MDINALLSPDERDERNQHHRNARPEASSSRPSDSVPPTQHYQPHQQHLHPHPSHHQPPPQHHPYSHQQTQPASYGQHHPSQYPQDHSYPPHQYPPPRSPRSDPHRRPPSPQHYQHHQSTFQHHQPPPQHPPYHQQQHSNPSSHTHQLPYHQHPPLQPQHTHHQQQLPQQQPSQQQQTFQPHQYHPQAAAPASSGRTRPTPPGSRHSPSSLSREIPRSPDRLTSSTSSPSSHQYHSSTKGTPGSKRHAADSHARQTINSPDFGGRRPSQVARSDADSQALLSPAQTPHRPSVSHRPVSTSQVDTLADKSSRQRQAAARAYSTNSIRQADQIEKRISPLQSPLPAAPVISRNISRQSVVDIIMADAAAPTPPPRDYSGATVSESESRTVNDLLNVLRDNSFAYDYHVQLVELLHKGFRTHVESSEDSDPHDYALLSELRQAREAMDSRFAVGEAIWMDWLADESLIASTTDERMQVTELFERAVHSEPASVSLWTAFIDWMSNSHAVCFDQEGADASRWSAESKEDCRSLFDKNALRGVLEEAVTSTKWRTDQSQSIWSRYIALVLQDFPENPTRDDIERIQSIFVERLQVPHANSSDTEQSFWSAVSKVPGLDWEAIMSDVKRVSEPAKHEIAVREDDEFALQRALQSEDASVIKAAYEEFLRAERFRKRGLHYHEIRCDAYERALLRFPTETEWWLDYIDYFCISHDSDKSLLFALIERATRHCPGSGELWSRLILQADRDKRSREDTEAIKHRATNSGLLELGGMEELVKVLQQWCSYLRRHAFSEVNLEDERDTAEFGIFTALEDINQAGKRLYGDSFEGDPLFRLEQVQIKFYTESRRMDQARNVYEALAQKPMLARSYDFWNKYYNWELHAWGCDLLMKRDRVESEESSPRRATKVVQMALKQKELDQPAGVLELYLYHFQQHESAEKLQTALVDSRAFTMRLARQAEKAQREAAEQQARYTEAAAAAAATPSTTNGEKRKREDEGLTNGQNHKKSKTGPAASEEHEDTGKRDREHNTVTVKNLPSDATEGDLRDFFHDFGTILAVNMLPAGDDGSVIATVEFESHEDASASVIRSGKQIKGREVSVHSGGQNILYVCNYPAEYDEAAIRDLFKHQGEIVSVRFPSLNLNARRRFCYVSFLTPEMAKAAETAMDGKKLDGLHTLTAKISNPEAKKSRSGPQHEGREIFIKNIDRNASEDEVKTFFAQYGAVESLHLLRNLNQIRIGTGFVVYKTAEEAQTAIADADRKPFHDRILSVQLSTPKGKTAAPHERMKKQDIIVKHTSVEPSNGDASARRGSDVSMHSTTPAPAGGDDSYKTVFERRAAIFDLPDTVNDARVRTALEKYGALVKIQMRRDIQGAIVEFVDQKDAFNVRAGVDVTSLGPGVTTGDVADLLQRKKNKKQKPTTNPLAMVPASVARGGKRGGLGVKRGTGGVGHAAVTATASTTGEGDGKKADGGDNKGDATAAAPKSNADFRRMFTASAAAAAPPAADEQAN